MMLHFVQPSKLKTKKIVFEDVYAACDSATLEHLKELSSKRKAIEDSINESSFITEAIAKEMSGGLESRYEQDVHKIEQYLPLLENLFPYADVTNTNYRMAQCTAALKIRWSSALSTSSFFNFKGPKFFQIDNLRFELGMTLFLCGGILRERALEVLSTDLVQSATIFRQASGIYQHLAQDVLPPLQPALPLEKPPEALAAVSTIMSLICLAEAQAVTIRKAEEKGTSSSLLAKLHHGVTLFLEEAIGIFHTVVTQCKDISSRLLEFMYFCKCLHELKGQQYHAESLKACGQIGAAIGVLCSVLSNVKKKIPGEEPWKSIYQKQIEDASEVLRKFVHENDFVWHEKIPSGDELPLPEGNKIVTFKPYSPKRWETPLAFKRKM
ncbi:programmed cell death 6-interacting protein isoform X1 [Cajanus cajan]|uniref:BRO1 domain-containing protein BROX n=1 Tax=Cajanus cajan TaxID=3821 RepID=A0A151RZB7_CAJCA|nr:programmed cell death 6-interacting protein isoform X1 [Cajanus cajan]KYP47827.1 BRO1 domain-containing protein BROX [Cajanus cajan]